MQYHITRTLTIRALLGTDKDFTLADGLDPQGNKYIVWPVSSSPSANENWFYGPSYRKSPERLWRHTDNFLSHTWIKWTFVRSGKKIKEEGERETKERRRKKEKKKRMSLFFYILGHNGATNLRNLYIVRHNGATNLCSTSCVIMERPTFVVHRAS